MKASIITFAALAFSATFATDSFGQSYHQQHPQIHHHGQQSGWGNQGVQQGQDRPVLRFLTQVAENAAQANQIQQAQNQLAIQKMQLNAQRTQQQMIHHNTMLNQQRQAMIARQRQILAQQNGIHPPTGNLRPPTYSPSNTEATGDWGPFGNPQSTPNQRLQRLGITAAIAPNMPAIIQYQLHDQAARRAKQEWDHIRQTRVVPKIARPGELSRQGKKAEKTIKKAGRDIGKVFGW